MQNKSSNKNIIKGRWYNINKKINKRLIAKYHKIKDWKMDPKGYFLIGVDKKKKFMICWTAMFQLFLSLPKYIFVFVSLKFYLQKGARHRWG